MKIVFVNRYFFPDHSASSQLLTDLASYLGDRGHDVHVVTSRQRYDDPFASFASLEIRDGVTIHRVRTSRFGRANLFGRALDYLTFYFTAATTLRGLATKGAIVVAKTDPPLISIVAAWATHRQEAILVNWLQDLFPEIAERLGVRGFGGLVADFLRLLRNRSLRAATLNVVVGKQMAARLNSLGISNDTISVVHNWADGNEIRPLGESHNPLKEEWGLNGKFVIGYSGNMGRAHEFDTALAAAEALKHEADYVFLFCGGGNKSAWIQEQAQARGLTNVILKPYQPRDALARSLGVADVHLISLLPTLDGLVVPSKFYGIAATGRPTVFIGDPGGEIPQVLEEHGIGITVRPGDVEGLVSVLRDLKAQPDKVRRMGAKARALFERAYDKPIAMAKWDGLLNDVFASGRRNVSKV